MNVKVFCHSSNLKNYVTKEVDLNKLNSIIPHADKIDGLYVSSLRKLGELQIKVYDEVSYLCLVIMLNNEMIYGKGYYFKSDDEIELVGDKIYEVIQGLSS